MERLQSMAFREKEAWATLVAMLIAYGGYFTAVAALPVRGIPSLHFVVLFAVATVVRVAIEFGGRALMAASAWREARARADERDRAIAARATNTGYATLLVGTMLVGVVMPAGGYGGWEVANAALFVIVAAECCRVAATILGYRRA